MKEWDGTLPIWTHSSGEEEAEVGAWYAVCTGVPRVSGNVAACLCMFLGGEGVVVSAGPF